MNRRHFLASAGALAGIAALAGCATGSPPLAQVVADVQTIASGLSGAIEKLPPGIIPGGTPSVITAALADLQAVAASIGAADTAAAAQPLVQRVAVDVNVVVGALASLPLPAPVSTAFQAAMVLLPVIEAAVGMMVPAGATPGAMTPAQARVVLRDAAIR